MVGEFLGGGLQTTNFSSLLKLPSSQNLDMGAQFHLW